jgi:hypothetical protein
MPTEPCHRRAALLRLGALGAGWSALSLPRLLRAEAKTWARASAKAKGTPPAPTPVRAVILLAHYGGPSHLDLWDPKPDAPDGIRGEFAPIATSLPGLRVTEQLPRTARLADRLTVIRSMTHSVANHNPATYLTLTGRTSTRDVALIGAGPTDWPAMGSVVARLRPGGAEKSTGLPDFVSLPHVVTEGVLECPGQFGGMLGKAYDPLVLERDPAAADFAVPELTLPADLPAARLDDRRALHRLIDDRARAFDRSSSLARGLDASYARAYDLLTSPAARRAFDLTAEDPRTRDRYGRNKVGQSYLLARRLVEAGVRFVTCFNGQNPGDKFAWDTHTDNFPRLRRLCPPDDQAFSALLEDLEGRGLLDSTLVLWAGEFGRKPQIGKPGAVNNVTPSGRDHWPQCYTIALAGGGIRRGHVHGGSDAIGAYPTGDAVSPADLAATVLWAMGIDPETTIHNQLGQPFAVAAGRPVTSLFG